MDLPKHPCVEKLRELARANPAATYELPPQIAAKVEQEFVIEKVSAVRELLVVQLHAFADEVRRRGGKKLAEQLDGFVSRFAGKQHLSLRRDERQAMIEAKAAAARRARALLAMDSSVSVPAATDLEDTRERPSNLVSQLPRLIRG